MRQHDLLIVWEELATPNLGSARGRQSGGLVQVPLEADEQVPDLLGVAKVCHSVGDRVL
jgi:hypothetical protein